MAEAGPLSDFQQAHADLARAQLAFVTSRGSDAPRLLLKAARRLEPIDPACPARPTWTRCPPRSSPAGLATPGSGVREVARAAGAAPPPPHAPRAPDLLLDGLAAQLQRRVRGGRADAARRP